MKSEGSVASNKHDFESQLENFFFSFFCVETSQKVQKLSFFIFRSKNKGKNFFVQKSGKIENFWKIFLGEKKSKFRFFQIFFLRKMVKISKFRFLFAVKNSNFWSNFVGVRCKNPHSYVLRSFAFPFPYVFLLFYFQIPC